MWVVLAFCGVPRAEKKTFAEDAVRKSPRTCGFCPRCLSVGLISGGLIFRHLRGGSEEKHKTCVEASSAAPAAGSSGSWPAASSCSLSHDLVAVSTCVQLKQKMPLTLWPLNKTADGFQGPRPCSPNATSCFEQFFLLTNINAGIQRLFPDN